MRAPAATPTIGTDDPSTSATADAVGAGWLASVVRAAGLHGAWIGLWSLIGLVGTVLTPFLLQRPVLLLALSPRTVSVALAASELDLMAFVLLGVVRLSVADWSYFQLGRRAGVADDRPSLLARLASRLTFATPLRWVVRLSDRLASLVCRSVPTAALVLALRPNGRYLAIAGAYGVSARVAAAASLAGTVGYLVIVHRSISVVVA